jgi:hypothetical protein
LNPTNFVLFVSHFATHFLVFFKKGAGFNSLLDGDLNFPEPCQLVGGVVLFLLNDAQKMGDGGLKAVEVFLIAAGLLGQQPDD